MGTTLTTLNLYGAERSEIEAMLAPTDLLRDQNSPWLTIVPLHGSEDSNYERLEKAAKKLTKQNDAAALLFYYFDDDRFTCSLYQSGRKSASCQSFQSWAKLGKKLSERLGDAALPKAFRYSINCSSLEEQIELLEETIGTALYELQEDEPRTVLRGDATLRRIKAREAMLKKRPNKFKLTELDPGDWPRELQYRQKLYDTLRPQWQKYGLTFFMHQTDMSRNMVPGSEGLIAYSYTSDWSAHQDNLLFLNGKTGECTEFGPFDGSGAVAVWQTKSGETVILLPRYKPTLQELKEGRQESPFRLLCVSRDGTEQWNFQPELTGTQTLQHVHTSEQGVITLFAGGIYASVKADARIFMIDGNTGKLLHTLSYPYQDNMQHMIHVAAMNAFLLCRRSANELVLLDETLCEMQTFEGFTGSYYFNENQLCGSILWEGDSWNHRFVTLYDLQNKTERKINLEIQAYPIAVLQDGRILGINEKQNVLTVFDPAGNVAARCTVPGKLSMGVLNDGRVCLTEVRGPDTHGYVCDELFDETSVHVWRLDPVPPKQ